MQCDNPRPQQAFYLCNRYREVPKWIKHSGAETTSCASQRAFQLPHKQIYEQDGGTR